MFAPDTGVRRQTAAAQDASLFDLQRAGELRGFGQVTPCR